jgi:hypothetical protein
MGLKCLRNFGAIKMVYVLGGRHVHYEAVAELRNLASRFLRDQIVPHLDSGLYRLEHIADMVKQLPAEDLARVSARVTMLTSWEKKSRKFLPVILKVLGAWPRTQSGPCKSLFENSNDPPREGTRPTGTGANCQLL